MPVIITVACMANVGLGWRIKHGGILVHLAVVVRSRSGTDMESGTRASTNARASTALYLTYCLH